MDVHVKVVCVLFVLFSLLSQIRGDEERSLGHLIFDFRLNYTLNPHNATKTQSTLVADRMGCLDTCAKASWCKSGNLKTIPEKNGLYICEVISTDEYNKNNTLARSQEYQHFRIKTPCELFQGTRCLNGGECVFVNQTHQCKCHQGYEGKGCEKDIDECATNKHNCDPNANCTNTQGSFNCTCKQDYGGNGTNCKEKSCLVLMKKNVTTSGRYWINPTGTQTFLTYCDMETDGGGWTLVWAYTFLMYDSFTNGQNAVTPTPTNYNSLGTLSSIPPQNETDYNAIDFNLWKSIGSEVLLKSNINNWFACKPGTGSFVEGKGGSMNCRMVKQIAFECSLVPTTTGNFANGVFLKSSSYFYYYDTGPTSDWPVHDPCGSNSAKHLKNISNPHGNIYVR